MKVNTEIIRVWAGKKNFIPKLASIILAVILWGYLTSTKSGDIKFRLPLNYRNLDQTLTVSRLSNKYIMVRIKGRKDELKTVNSKNIKVFADLSSAKIGEYGSFPVQIEKTDLPEEVEVVVNPEEIKLFVEKKAFRNILIVPRFSGDPEKDVVLGKIKTEPEYVRIAGSAGLLSGIESINTEYIFLNDRHATFKSSVKLEKVNEEEIDYSLSEVDVTVPLIPVSETASIDVPLLVKNKIKGFVYNIEYDKASVSVLLPNNRDTANPDMTAYIDASEIPIQTTDLAANGRIEKEAVVHVKSGYSDESGIISVKPQKIKVIITRE